MYKAQYSQSSRQTSARSLVVDAYGIPYTRDAEKITANLLRDRYGTDKNESGLPGPNQWHYCAPGSARICGAIHGHTSAGRVFVGERPQSRIPKYRGTSTRH